MIKFKRLAFITVIVVATLLAIGNLTTLAQANSSDDIFTPTPTGTPIIDPNAQGEPVSLEQQEELKAVIQSYFEIRYSVLSISQPYGFRPDSFGDLVSAESDAKTFLDAELGKLAVEIKYSELNRSRYVDYKYFLNFGNFSMDAATQLVTVSVVEDNETISEISAERDPEKPLVAQMGGLKHTIVLRREQDQWRIVSDHYNDFLWRTLRRTGKSTEEMLNILSTVEAPTVTGPSSEGAQTETASLRLMILQVMPMIEQALYNMRLIMHYPQITIKIILATTMAIMAIAQILFRKPSTKAAISPYIYHQVHCHLKI